MSRSASPLRYPGGKSCLLGLVASILSENKYMRCDYAEPYAGGCGLALSLLYGGHVGDIHINDIDLSIWSFWKSILDHTDEFVLLVEKTPVTMAEWIRQKEIQTLSDSSDPLRLGFSTFFLNRTNRSGIIQGAGVIGGTSQNGSYKIDCRFNKEDLVHRIRRIKKYRSRIHLYNLDALQFMSLPSSFEEDTFFCIDPPYFNKGSSLYTSFYQPEDHSKVAAEVLKLPYPWIVTYDNVEEIQKLYGKRRQFIFDINYSIQTKRVGNELLIASKGLKLPSDLTSRKSHESTLKSA